MSIYIWGTISGVDNPCLTSRESLDCGNFGFVAPVMSTRGYQLHLCEKVDLVRIRPSKQRHIFFLSTFSIDVKNKYVLLYLVNKCWIKKWFKSDFISGCSDRIRSFSKTGSELFKVLIRIHFRLKTVRFGRIRNPDRRLGFDNCMNLQ